MESRPHASQITNEVPTEPLRSSTSLGEMKIPDPVIKSNTTKLFNDYLILSMQLRHRTKKMKGKSFVCDAYFDIMKLKQIYDWLSYIFWSHSIPCNQFKLQKNNCIDHISESRVAVFLIIGLILG